MADLALQKLRTDVKELKKDVREIKTLLLKNPELREEIVQELMEARKTPKSKYISHDAMRKEFS